MDILLNQQFGDYRLIKLLGHGHFGQVYLGEHVDQNTLVAVKVLEQRPTSDMQEASEFRNEALAQNWIHPNIIRIRDAGTANGRYYLIMDYAPHGNMRKQHRSGTPLPWITVVGYVLQIADALQYVHTKGKVHRDVKPENLLIGVNGELLLSDFGLTITSYTLNPTELQEAQGTVAYMAPEQFSMHAVRESDQYSLGVLMFEWLSGSLPFEGSAPIIFYKHMHSPPPALREFVPELPAVVEAIVMKLLKKDPHDRYSSMNSLIEALKQVQIPVTPIKPRILHHHQDSIRAVAWAPNGLLVASAGLDKTVYVWEAATGTILCKQQVHSAEVWGVAWSPDSQYIASVGADRALRVWNATTSELIKTYYGHNRIIHAVSWSDDGQYIATASEDETVRLWKPSASTDSPVNMYRHRGRVYSIAWSPHSRYLASSGEDGTVYLWVVASGFPIRICRSHTDRVMAVAWSLDGEYLASGSDDSSVCIWQAASGKLLQKLVGHSLTVSSLAWLPVQGRHILASGSWDQTIRLWDIDSQQPLSVYRGHKAWVTTLSASPNREYIASGSWDQTVHLWHY